MSSGSGPSSSSYAAAAAAATATAASSSSSSSLFASRPAHRSPSNANSNSSNNNNNNGSGSSSTPSYTTQQDRYGMAGGSGAGGGSPAFFTPEMRDRQARGKDPYCSGDNSDASDLSVREGAKMVLGGSHEKEKFNVLERRRQAATVLDSPELTMMFAQSNGDSVPATRLKYTRMLCGYDDGESKKPKTSATRRGGVVP